MRCLLKQQRTVCTLRQNVSAEMPADYETAFTICKRNNEIVRGNGGAGGRFAVTLDIGCPDGYHPIGLWHSHPGGTTEPSKADIEEMKKLGLENLCISVPQTGELRCTRVKRGRY